MVAVLLLSAAPALADPTLGCFSRAYTAEHLAAHPAQFVQAIRMKLEEVSFDGGSTIEARMSAVIADRARAHDEGMGGRILTQVLSCFQTGDGTGWRCAVDCDGGGFDINRDDGEVMDLSTSYLIFGDWEDCGGLLDLAEVIGEPVTYRLTRADPAVCEGL